MKYCQLNEDGSISQFTENGEIAQELGFEYSTEEEMVMAWDGKLYVESQIPEKSQEQLELERQASIPSEITAYQARAVLDDYGLLEQVEAAMPLLNKKIQIAWEYALTFKRNHPFIQSLISQFGITEAQLDEMFIAGANYE